MAAYSAPQLTIGWDNVVFLLVGSAFTSFATILTVPAAYLLLKERGQARLKLVAAALGTLGLIILNT